MSIFSGDFGPHRPVGMIESLFYGDVLHLPACECAERPTACRQKNLAGFRHFFAVKTLEYGRMLRIDGEKLHTMLPDEGRYDGTSDHESLLIGQSYGLATLYGVDCREQSAVSDESGEHNIDIVGASGVSQSLLTAFNFNAGAFEFASER